MDEREMVLRALGESDRAMSCREIAAIERHRALEAGFEPNWRLASIIAHVLRDLEYEGRVRSSGRSFYAERFFELA